MADTTIDVPYSGGTFQTGDIAATHYVNLGNGKVLHAFTQFSPSMTFAWVCTMTNLAGTATKTPGPMRAVLPSAKTPYPVSALRLFKMSATRALMLINGVAHVLEIQPNDDVLLVSTNSISSVVSQGTPFASNNETIYGNSFTSHSGSAWQGFYARDNVVYITDRTYISGRLLVVLKKLTYDDSTKTLSMSSIRTLVDIPGAAGGYAYTRVSLSAIPNSTKRTLMVLAQRSGEEINGYPFLIDGADVATPLPATPFAGNALLCPFSEDRILAVTGSEYSLLKNGTWTVPANYGDYMLGTLMIHAEALDADHFMVIRSDVFARTNTTRLYCKVGKFIDETFGLASPPTTARGITLPESIGSIVLMFDQQFIFRESFNQFQINYCLRNLPAKARIRTMHLPIA